MLRTFLVWANRCIEYSFYALFFLVPLIIANDTFELFEFNKMWITFGFTIVIVSCWLAKMVVSRRFLFQRTLLDIPLGLFLLSQIIATIFSLDPHVSFWGYYSRFNGGLLSIATYITLYYAFVSNLLVRPGDEHAQDLTYGKFVTKRLLSVSVITALVVGLWGLPSHFGHDPTCLIFRGTLDVSCWTDAFKPMIRMFSTLGQPNWLAAYMAIILPIFVAYIPVLFPSFFAKEKLSTVSFSQKLLVLGAVITGFLFFIDLSYTDSQSGYLAFLGAFGLLGILLFFLQPLLRKKLVLLFGLFVVPFLVFFFFGSQPVARFDPFTWEGISTKFATPPAPGQKATTSAPKEEKKIFPGELGGTDSFKIRSIVWKGALAAWRDNWLIGTGVETFAFAYYKYRPVEHNLTSEWDFLYNKAHNEYINYLTTTGVLGLGTHLLIIVLFAGIVLFTLYRKRTSLSSETILLVTGLFAAYAGIIVTNFAGFSVVIVNLYFYLIHAWALIFLGLISPAKYYSSQEEKEPSQEVSLFQWLIVCIVGFFALYYIVVLYQYWEADKAYALGYNRNRVNQYDLAYTDLRKAIELRGDEPVFKDEFAVNNAVLASAYAYQKDTENAKRLSQQAVIASNQVVEEFPNNVVFWKTRVRMFYILSQYDPKYLGDALQAIQRANALAPTDAKISYNLGLLYGQNGQKEKAVEVLEKTTKMKWDYQDAWYALGLYAREAAVNSKGQVINPTMQQKATDAMHYILENISPDNKEVMEQLKSWGE